MTSNLDKQITRRTMALYAESYSHFDAETGELSHEHNQERHYTLLRVDGDYWALTCGESLVCDSEHNEDEQVSDEVYDALTLQARGLGAYNPVDPTYSIGHYAESIMRELSANPASPTWWLNV